MWRGPTYSEYLFLVIDILELVNYDTNSQYMRHGKVV